MGEVFLAGRILVGGYYLLSAAHHFADLGALAEHAAAVGVPLPALAVAVAGILLAVAGLTVILGIYPDIGIAALLLFFIPVTIVMHAFWADRKSPFKGFHNTYFQEHPKSNCCDNSVN